MNILKAIRERVARRNTLLHLEALDDHLLRDIGLERSQIRQALRGGRLSPRQG